MVLTWQGCINVGEEKDPERVCEGVAVGSPATAAVQRASCLHPGPVCSRCLPIRAHALSAVLLEIIVDAADMSGSIFEGKNAA